MAVDEQIARAWGRLAPAGMGRVDIPDPATQPEAWIRAFLLTGTDVRYDPCHDGHLHVYIGNRQFIEWLGWDQFGQATEAAIRAWEAAHAN